MLAQYLTTCNFFWMFCEGLYLHTVVVVAFVSGNKLLIACCVIGWGELALAADFAAYMYVSSLFDRKQCTAGIALIC